MSIINYLGASLNYETFAIDTYDPYKFWMFSQEYIKTPISTIFKETIIDHIHIVSEGGYLFYIGSLASLATKYGDGNHLLFQFLGSTFFASLTSIPLYNFFSSRLSPQKAYHYALAFMVLSLYSTLSASLGRDIVISFFYIWGFSIISRDFSFKGVISLVFITIILTYLRFAHGVFFVFFIIYYFYIKFEDKKAIFIVLTLVAVIAFGGTIIDSSTKVESKLESYTNLTENFVAEKEDSFTKFFWKLPTPFKETAIIINSQIQPFPSWLRLKNTKNIFDTIINALPIVYSFFWFVVFFSIVKWGFIQRKINKLDKKIILLLLIVLVFFIGNSANMTLRRIVSVYPIIFLAYAILKEKYIPKKDKANFLLQPTITYIAMITFYLTFKFVF